jgi:hypothetical protein
MLAAVPLRAARTRLLLFLEMFCFAAPPVPETPHSAAAALCACVLPISATWPAVLATVQRG